jgi:hypothetical protein
MDTTQYLQRDGSNPGNDWVLMVRSGVVNSNEARGELCSSATSFTSANVKQGEWKGMHASLQRGIWTR